MNEYKSVDSMIEEVKGTTGFLSGLISRKSGLLFLIVILGVIASKIIFS